MVLHQRKYIKNFRGKNYKGNFFCLVSCPDRFTHDSYLSRKNRDGASICVNSSGIIFNGGWCRKILAGVRFHNNLLYNCLTTRYATKSTYIKVDAYCDTAKINSVNYFHFFGVGRQGIALLDHRSLRNIKNYRNTSTEHCFKHHGVFFYSKYSESLHVYLHRPRVFLLITLIVDPMNLFLL